MEFPLRKILVSVGVVIAVAVTAVCIPSLFEDLDANHIMVIQSPVEGNLVVHTDPGFKYQGFGTVTKYPRRATYAFDGKNGNACKHIQFNDGGKATLCGSVQWEMPLVVPDVIAVHKAFNSAPAVQTSAVSSMLDAALYLAGPLMTSVESMAERKAELVQVINDQAEHGVYVTKVVRREIEDVAGKREVTASEIVRDEQGRPRRQQGSILAEFKIKLLPMSINNIKYDDVVEKQIAERQSATTQVQIAQANAKRAEQEKLTTEAQGAANAAKAKWEQETIKAKLVTEAEQKLKVAELAAKEAEQYKRQQVLIGEGDAQRKQLAMAADGALEAKLEVYRDVNRAYADAIKNANPFAWSPHTVMGGNGQSGARAGDLIDLLTAKTAKDMGLDMSIGGKTATVKK
jgi:hypothetical protein